MALTHEQRRERDALKARLRQIEDPAREARKIAEAKRRAKREVSRQPRISHARAKPKGGRELDPAYMSWQHDSGLVCIACEIEGPPHALQLKGEPNPIEVAHQRVTGWKKGVREHDKHSCVLCRWHHQIAPNACDKGQRKFWERLGIDAGDYCATLYSAFKGGFDGRAVQRRFIPTRPE